MLAPLPGIIFIKNIGLRDSAVKLDPRSIFSSYEYTCTEPSYHTDVNKNEKALERENADCYGSRAI